MKNQIIDSGEQVRHLYTTKAKLYDFLFSRLLGWQGAMKRFFNRHNFLFSGCKVLDVGCGSGAATKALYGTAQTKKVTSVIFHGFDLTPAMLQLFKQWTAKNHIDTIQLQTADVLNTHMLPKDWHQYDLIIFSGVLEYLPKDKISLALIHLKSLLQPNGTLIGFISKQTFFNKLIQHFWKQALFDEASVRNMFSNAGFGNITLEQLPFPDNHIHNWCHVVVAKL